MATRRAFNATLFGVVLMGTSSQARPSQARPTRTTIVPFQTSPFPYDGPVPDSGRPFLDTMQGDQRAHTSPRGGVYPLDPTYSDRSVLLAIPPRFDPAHGHIVVYLHGNLARLERDVVERQRVVAQVVASKADVVLIAPQFAVDALDSSAGHFWDDGGFTRFLDEAATRLAAMSGLDAEHFAAMPVVLVAYSGGYNPAAAILSHDERSRRVAGVVLLDALYGEIETFGDWLARRFSDAFFVSAFSTSSKAGNLALQADLRAKGIAYEEGLPAHLRPGAIGFIDAGAVVHDDFVTRAWVADPLRAILARIGR
jgi:hypothetical protein